MSRLVFRNEVFQCPLLCEQCDHLSPSGKRCKRTVCFGWPTCWQHSKIDYGVKTKKSTIPGAGRGLFATRSFDSYEFICPYEGEVVSETCLEQRYPGNAVAPYAVNFDEGNFIDSACIRGIGSIANGLFVRGISQPRYRHDAVIAPDDEGVIWLQAIKPIPQGKEIFVYYGTDYELEDNYETVRTKDFWDTDPCFRS